MSNVPDDCLYTKEHEWLRMGSDHAVMGITEYAAGELGDVTYVELPSVGQDVQQGSALGSVESVKAVSDIYAPAGGKVVAVNDDLEDEPGLVNEDPYADGWMCRIELSDEAELDNLLKPDDYREFLAGLAE